MSHISSLAVRPVRASDLAAAADLLMLTSATGVRHQLEQQVAAAVSGERGCAFVAEQDGVPVGSALLSSEPTFPGSVITLVAVSPSARASGVGGALADVLDERLTRETLPASCRLRDDLPDGRRFAERRGFTVRGHSVGFTVDLAALDGTVEGAAREAARAAGVVVRRAGLPRELDRVLECAARCMPGMPEDQRDADPRHAGGYIPADAVVLLAEEGAPGGKALGVTIIAPSSARDGWYTLFTGVDAAHRRRGIARALKTESFLRARRAGGCTVLTHNHDSNEAVIGLNAGFGMRPAPGYWDLRRAHHTALVPGR